ncbi:MAG: glycosyltransferase [Bacteroidales bacterium]|jgi:glycosyltransferase involved in cell wall biosynthesis|nr:glycosyltransferase [Bacteroidales bacterium]
MKITLIGTAYPYRGGLALFNERLIEEFSKQNDEVKIETFSLQYPSFLFPGKSQYSTEINHNSFPIIRSINSINPFSWIKVGLKLKKEKPDIVIVKYWMPFFALCFSTILSLTKKNHKTKIIAIIDNIIPHEKRFLDSFLTRLFTKSVDGFIAMSKSVFEDIYSFEAIKPRILSPHPLFDNFGEKISKKEALEKLNLKETDINLLFFGLIRKYKGLDMLLEALSDERLRKYPIKLVVAGEFYEDSTPYYDMVKKLNLEDKVIFHPRFIPDSEVKNYFCATDLLVLPYRNATQSGVTQISYHFEKPMLVTNVGGLAEIIPNNKVGYVVEANVKSISDALVSFCESSPSFIEGIEQEKMKYSWERMSEAIKKLYKQTTAYDNKK